MVQHSQRRRRARNVLIVPSLALLIMLLLNACGDPQVQQKASQNKAELDKLITHAQSIGVPASMLKPIIDQEKSLSQTSQPLLSNQSDDYNANLGQRYKTLTLQVRGLETQATQQLTYQASLDLQTFEDILGQRQAQHFVEAKTFADQLAQDQVLMNNGQSPKTFIQISNNAKDSTQALRLLGSTYDKLTSLQGTVAEMQASNLDTTALDQQVQSIMQLFRTAKNAADFTVIDHQLDAQLQGSTTLSVQAIPYVGKVKLKQLSDDIDLLKQAGLDASKFQQQHDTDQAALTNAKSLNDYLTFSAQLDSDLASTRIPLLQAQVKTQVQLFHQEVKHWGDTHQYHDAFDGVTYRFGYEYDAAGIGSDADAFLAQAQTPDDYQAVLDLVNDDMFNLKQMEADSTDTTPANQPHTADKKLLQHYKVTSGQVLVVSLAEQALRLYQDGNLVYSFLITSGQYYKPSLPGFWHIIDRESPTKFVSGASKGSAFWYPDTKINYAIGYHSGGYFLHDSWWRADYGPHTNFPHVDSGGDQSFSGNGSHGCINMPEDQASWIYAHTSYNTAAIIY